MPRCIVLIVMFAAFVIDGSAAQARQWSDPSGRFKLEADAVAFNDTTVLLKRPSGKLVAVELAELSSADQNYVASKEAAEALPKPAEEMQTWTSKDGLKVRGRVLAYGRKNLDIRRNVGRIFVNDGRFSNLDPLHQKLVLKIMSELEGETFESEQQLEAWAKNQGLGAETKSYPLEGVLMELESGDKIAVPFFLFAKNELEILQPGWSNWVANEGNEKAQAQEDFLVQSSAQHYHQNYPSDRDLQQEQLQIERLKLEMMAVATGVVSIWEVMLRPNQPYGYQVNVMVPAANSEVASAMAMQNYPGYSIIGVRRASR